MAIKLVDASPDAKQEGCDMDTKILDNDKSNVKDKSNFLKTDDIVVVERYNQLGKKKKRKN